MRRGVAVGSARFGHTLGLWLSILWVGGCCSSRDVSDQAPYLIGYRPGVTYRLKQEAVLVEGNVVDQMWLEKALGPASKVVEWVPPGTTFRVDRIVRNDCAAIFQGEYWVDTFGVIVGGEFDGWPIAVRMSSYEWVRNKRGQAFVSLYKPDAEFVEEVGAVESAPQGGPAGESTAPVE